MGRRVQALVAVSVLATAASLANAGVAAHSSSGGTPSSSFKGIASGGAPGSSFTGSGTLGGSGDDGGGDDSGFGSVAPGPSASGPGGALSGMTVAAVRQLQSALLQLGYFHHAITGYYGVITTAAVKKFQRTAGLKADGIWGPHSAAALTKRLAG